MNGSTQGELKNPVSFKLMASPAAPRIPRLPWLPASSWQKGGSTESPPGEGFGSQVMKLHTGLPHTLHSLELGHMAHLTAAGPGKCRPTASPGRTGHSFSEQPASHCHTHMRNSKDASWYMNGPTSTSNSWSWINQGGRNKNIICKPCSHI